MNETIHLHHLQTIDHQIDKIDTRMAEIITLVESKTLVQEAEALSHVERKKSTEAKTRLRQIEDAVEKLRLKIELDEASLYGGRIHNPKELQDLQHEIVSLKKHMVELEEQQLEAMLALEQAENVQKSADDHLTQIQAKDIEDKSTLRGEHAHLAKQKERLLVERNAAVNSIPAEFLNIYSQLRKQKRGTAVSLVVDGGCSSCGSTLRPAEKQAARSPSQITYCSSCGRILYAG